ncbi:FKBP-type peptidyl-prolyl cis-trans isomerase [Luteolibacter arcticus]|uniref:Peptidyl-prolyl cis-trans isomerase n=1 Tax=Luteolibacter arcticus TaxID=1581411 RepID=A0ABT3GJ20_9BACT|nr:FKBP-type peptidyl-prolyl cis-trans isomerase [Luteolibacter arcticus]MCW1923492.1 FKBP-type peptidyl-prolyl cis-trans isomerase [Luteolibacter arcticus]
MKTISFALAGAAALFVAACDSKSDTSSNTSTSDSTSGSSTAGSSHEGSGAEESKPGKTGPREEKAKPEQKTTSSGLKYTVLKKGTGNVNPKASDTVTVHYHGTLLNGTVFDSSVDRAEPASFPLNRVIPGWTEGVQLMVVGDKFKFEVPANLAYGPQSPTPAIPPNSTLVFEVELLGIQ